MPLYKTTDDHSPIKQATLGLVKPLPPGAFPAPDTTLSALPGMGYKNAVRLEKLGLKTVRDLLFHLPRRYEDSRDIKTLSELLPNPDLVQTVRARIRNTSARTTSQKRMALVEASLEDDSGMTANAIWFNQPFLLRHLYPNMEMIFRGKIEFSKYNGITLKNPEFEMLSSSPQHLGRLTPVYPETEGLTSKFIRSKLEPLLILADYIDDPVPSEVANQYNLMPLNEALKQIHFPDDDISLEKAKERIAFEEIFLLQVAAQRARRRRLAGVGAVIPYEVENAKEFAASLPFNLTEGQRRACHEIFKEMAGPGPMNRLLQGDVGSGKSLSIDANILTPHGWREMGDIKVGDYVIGQHGHPALVKGVFPQGKLEMFKVTFNDGSTVECSEDHLWAVQTSNARVRNPQKYVIKTLGEIKETYRAKSIDHRRVWFIPMTEPVQFAPSEAQLPIEPYALGLLLGDGGMTSGTLRFTTADTELLRAFDNCGIRLKYNSKYDYDVLIDKKITVPTPQGWRNPMITALKSLGLLGKSSLTKFIPEIYKFSTPENRLAILQGLLDTDGSVAAPQSKVEYSSSSYQLIQDVQFLVQSLGGTARICPKPTKCAPHYRMIVKLPPQFSPFRLARKASLHRPLSKYPPYRCIEKIESVGLKEAQCIAVEGGLYLTEQFIVTHNTAVGAMAIHMAAKAGYQSMLMAPTEILARQHHATLDKMLSPHGWSVRLLVGSTPAKVRREILAGLMAGTDHVLVGTHALIEDVVQLDNLGLVIVDEQHRFGVAQRQKLRQKAKTMPNFLSMTATPIPRSMALTMYGDVSLSEIREMPVGRIPIETRVVPPHLRDKSYQFIRQQVQAGRQVFVICPLIEENDKLGIKSVTQEYEKLKTLVFPDLRMEFLHGKMAAKEKQERMAIFAKHEADVIVSTSVVEVGVDVPNATVMMIEGAERFGLAQLHQFRGRVGRSQYLSYCLLFQSDVDAEESRRLRAVADTASGFDLAEIDLRLRGPGDVIGQRQSGIPEIKTANLLDEKLLRKVQVAASNWLDVDPELNKNPALNRAMNGYRGVFDLD